MLEFDLRTPDSAFYFVLNLLGIDGQTFTEDYICNCNSDIEQLYDMYYNAIRCVNISDIRIIAFHVTGSLDDCQSIQQRGFLNLKDVLSFDNVVTQFFKKHDLYFDIQNKKMKHGKNIYSIDYEILKSMHHTTKQEESLYRISNRIYYDYCFNGFLHCYDVFSYSIDITKRPEFINDIVGFIPELKPMESEWKKLSKPYRIDFYADVSQVHRFNFELDDSDIGYKVWDELNDDDKIKKWMLGKAVDRAYDELGETYLYIRDDVVIPPTQIISREILKSNP